MQRYKLSLATVVFLSFVTLGTASAQIIYDNGTATGVTGKGYFADAVNGPDDDTAAGNVFTAGTTGTVGFVDFSAIYYATDTASTSDNFALNLYSATDAGPGSIIASDSFVSYTAMLVGSHTPSGGGSALDVYQLSGQLASQFTLTEGTTYYFSISDLTSASDDFAVVVSNSMTSGASNLEFSKNYDGNYDSDTNPLAFQLEAPEPSEWALLIMGCLGLALATRFKRRAS